MRTALQQFVTRYARNTKSALQHIHIANVQMENGETGLYAYWKEDQSILILQFFEYPSDKPGLSWLHHKARIDLKTDVVATEEQMNGSTYLVTSAWAQHIVDSCIKQGDLLLLKSMPGRQ
ncbi:hypothetical protein ACO0LC_24435 [Undibacterium sp. JH2W]|uniref:hypothetical protein n=1 Tax=Undibacterium sp. JH2W TaxID=3413037 RepID=UPI003BF3688F